MHHKDKDIDTAGTDADDEFRERQKGAQLAGPEPTAEPLGATPDDDVPRGSDPRTLHRAEDDEVAFERSPEFHDQPGSGAEAGDKARK
jgi:hypothetical protein